MASSTIVALGDVSTDTGLTNLNTLMIKNSYVSGYSPSQLDATVFAKVGKMPNRGKFPHAARWYRHISSYSEDERQAWKPVPSVSLRVEGAGAAQKADDEFDLFGEETAEEAAAAAAVAAAPKPAKVKKPVINKSQLVLHVKPASLETDLDKLETMVKDIVLDGLEWSVTCKKVPIAYGLMKLQIGCVIVDDLVNTDDIIERIECLGLDEAAVEKKIARRNAGDDDDEDDEEEPEGMVQSAEIVSFNKL